MSHRNHAFSDYRVRADKFQLSNYNIGFCVRGGEGIFVGGGSGGRHRRVVVRMVACGCKQVRLALKNHNTV